MPNDLVVKVEPWGPQRADMERIRRAIVSHPRLLRIFDGANIRLLRISPVYARPKKKTSEPRVPPTRFHATFFDYTHNQSVLVSGRLDNLDHIEISVTDRQPLPTAKEFNEAVKLLMNAGGEVSEALRAKRFKPYLPMPPLLKGDHRTIAIGLLPLDRRLPHLIVGIDMVSESAAPRRLIGEPGDDPCGLIADAEGIRLDAAEGAAWITVTQGGVEIWKFLAIRPAATADGGLFPFEVDSETVCMNGGAIELWDVDYRGKRVLGRANVPILTVKYDANTRGPYRDWQNQEGEFDAVGTDLASGFRECTSPPATILTSGTDVGSFLGVAIHKVGRELVLLSEMEAGEYRYTCEWRFHEDGTIRPRFGFSVVESAQVCAVHHHHAYWRFDFDITGSANDLVREFVPLQFPASLLYLTPFKKWIRKLEWKTRFLVETKRFRSEQTKWRILDGTGKGYELIPGHHDTPAQSMPDWSNDTDYPEFPGADLWVLRNHEDEPDDHVVAPGPPEQVDLDQFLDGESVYMQDIVVWYGGHVSHDFDADAPGTFGHIVGPTLRPIGSWN